MPDLMNPVLYKRLERSFGRAGGVKITNEGEAMVYTKHFLDPHTMTAATPPDPAPTLTPRRGRKRDPNAPRPYYDFVQGGEYYRVCCPYCADTRHRLYVSHMWGRKDEDGVPFTFLAVCYNEDCLGDDGNRRDFAQRLKFGPDLMHAEIARGVVIPEDERVFEWPGPVTRIDRLPDDHDAVAYVRARGFDPGVLGRYYGAAYCHNSVHFHAVKRLVIPVYADGVMRGWQARYVGELPWKNKDKKDRLPPKYYTCPRMKRAKLIGNFDNARKYKTVVLVEGWFDVFATGPWAGCIFGNFTSQWQRGTVAESARATGQSVVLMLDPQEFDSESTRNTVAELTRELPGRFAAVKLPDGTDPGGLGRDFILDYVTAEAGAQGVSVAFEKLGA